MLLYHYSNYDVDTLEVSQFGKHEHSSRDIALKVKRIFFYLEPKPFETEIFANCKYLYIVQIPDHEVYDLRKDTNQLFKKFGLNKRALMQFCSKKFICVVYSTEINVDVANVFRDIRPINKINL